MKASLGQDAIHCFPCERLAKNNWLRLVYTSTSWQDVLRTLSFVALSCFADTAGVRLTPRTMHLQATAQAVEENATGTEQKKLWGGRFTGATDPLMEKFNESLPFDKRMWREDLLVSRHSMLHHF